MKLKEKVLEINQPGKRREKEQYVQGVFNSIAPVYDLMNSLMSFGMHYYWRKYSVKKLGVFPGAKVLDGCSGTADFAMASASVVGESGQVVAFDFCFEMMRQAPAKLETAGYDKFVKIHVGDATQMALPDNYFDFATVGCGIRNLSSMPKGLSEIYRVLKPGGKFGCLDLGRPIIPVYAELYYFYFFHIVPKLGKLVLGNEEPYAYLPNSLHAFPKQEELKIMMEEANFTNVHYINLAGGAMALHIGEKPKEETAKTVTVPNCKCGCGDK